VDELVWNAARRLAYLVAGALALVGALLVRDAIGYRGGLFAELSAGFAACLVLGALVAILRVRRLFAQSSPPPAAPEDPYRQNARTLADEPQEPENARATRCAAGALVALAIAGAFVVVAAASR
jgi:hypothetical protein